MATLRDIEAQLYNHPAVKYVRRVRDETSEVVFELAYTLDGLTLHTSFVSVVVLNRSLPSEEAFFKGSVPPFLIVSNSFCNDAEAYVARLVDGNNVVGYNKVFCSETGGIAEYDLYKVGTGGVVVERNVVYSGPNGITMSKRV